MREVRGIVAGLRVASLGACRGRGLRRAEPPTTRLSRLTGDWIAGALQPTSYTVVPPGQTQHVAGEF